MQPPPITPNHPQSPNNHPQSSPITQNIVTITHNHPQSPKILSQSPPITQNIVTTSENVVTDSSNHPNIMTQTQQIWLTLFCENYYFMKKITNLRKSRVKVQKSGVKVQITNLRRKLLIWKEKVRIKVQKGGVKVHITNLRRKLLFHKETTKLQNYYSAKKITTNTDN